MDENDSMAEHPFWGWFKHRAEEGWDVLSLQTQ